MGDASLGALNRNTMQALSRTRTLGSLSGFYEVVNGQLVWNDDPNTRARRAGDILLPGGVWTHPGDSNFPTGTLPPRTTGNGSWADIVAALTPLVAQIANGGSIPTQLQRPNARVVGYDAQGNPLYGDSIGDAAKTAGGIFGQLGNYVSAHPYVVGGLALGGYLLFKDPPKRR